MPFDIEAARRDGYSDGEIAGFLAQQSGFDLDRATQDGYQPAEVVSYLSGQASAKPAAVAPPPVDDPFTLTPTASTPAATNATARVTNNNPKPERPSVGLVKELESLRDNFFSGVDQTIAAGKTVNAAAQTSQMQRTQEKLRALEASGGGATPEAEGLRKTLLVYSKRVPGAIAGAVEAQTDFERGSAMATRPAVTRVAEAKTWGEAWDAFKQAPYDVIAGVTAQSLPTMLPALAVGAVTGPVGGAVTMGLSGGAVEAGSSLQEFARDAGVDTRDPKSVEAFFRNPDNLSAALAYAGKRAGVIGAMDAASGGIAGKTLAPALRSQVARQAINLPAQMGVQAAAGAGGEAGAQLVTKGRIDQPGQILLEAVGELGGAPSEVVAFGRHAARPAPATTPDPVAAIQAAPTVDAAISAALSAVDTALAGRAGEVNRTGGSERSGAPAPAGGLLASGLSSPLPGESGQAPAVPLDTGTAALTAPTVVHNETGTVTIRGDTKALIRLLKSNGITKVLQVADGVLVGVSQAAQAAQLLADFSGAGPLSAPAIGPAPVLEPATAPDFRHQYARAREGDEGLSDQYAPAREQRNPLGIEDARPSIGAVINAGGAAPDGPGVLEGRSGAPGFGASAPGDHLGAGAAPSGKGAGRDDPLPKPRAAIREPALAAITDRIAELEASMSTVPAAIESAPQSDPIATLNPTGTLYVRGDKAVIKAMLQEAGVTNAVPNRDGYLVAVSQAQRAAAAFRETDIRPPQTSANPGGTLRPDGAVGLEASQAPAQPQMSRSPGATLSQSANGALMITGDSGDLRSFLASKGVWSVVPRRGGVAVGRTQAGNAREAMQSYVPPAARETRDDRVLTNVDIAAAIARGAGSTPAAPAAVQNDQRSREDRVSAERMMIEDQRRRARPEAPPSDASRASQVLEDEDASFRRDTPADAPTLRLSQVQRAVDKLTLNWLRKPEIHVLDSMDHAPEPVRRVWEQQNSKGAVGDIEGFHWRGGVYLVADKLHSGTDVIRVLFHEALGHFGLRNVYGNALDGVLREIAGVMPKEVRAKAEQYGLDLTDPKQRLTAAEEVLAEMAQTRPTHGLVKRAIAAIRTWLRENVPGFADLKLTEAEIIENFLVPARDFVERGRTPDSKAVESGEARFSRAPATNSQAFKDWFGDSKVVGAEGKPLVVYHGTNKSEDGDAFTMFDSYASNYGLFGQGAYFTENPEVASSYVKKGRGDAPTVYPAYMSLQNPIDMDAEADDAAWRKAFDDIDFDAFAPNGDTNEAYYRAAEEDLTDREIPRFEGAEIMQDGLRKMGHDGIAHIGGGRVRSEGSKHRVFIAFDPEQIKSATGNLGAFDATNPDIRFSRHSQGEPAGWGVPAPTKTDEVLYELQDGRIDLKRAMEAIRESGREVEEQFDARQAETLYPGRVAHRSQQFLEIEVRPLLQFLALNNIKLDEVSDFLIARHAPERNAQVAKVNPGMPDGGAGRNSEGTLMTTKAAEDYLAALEPKRRNVLENAGRRIDAITEGTRRLLVEEGLEKPETVKAWESAYKFYAPLFKDEAAAGTPHPIGAGFSVKGGASKRATGSTKQVTDVLGHLLMQREAAITRAEKNRVGLSLYGLVLAHPNSDFWTTIRPGMSPKQIAAELAAMGVDPGTAAAAMDGVPTIRTVDDNTQQLVDRPNPLYKSLPGALVVKVAGEDRVVMLNVQDERALRLAESLKNLDGLTKLDLANSLVGKATRWIASVNTQYNPVFGFVNVIRDVQNGVVNLTSTELEGHKAEILGNVPAALVGIARDLRGSSKRTEWSDLFAEFQEAGAQTGYRELFRDAGDRTKAIEQELSRLQSEGRLTSGKAIHAVLDLLDDFNTALENAVRLSTFKAGIDSGMSKAAAAKVARELTVDFNRKGRAGRELGPLYAFFNASMQGTARTIETLKGPAGAKIITGGLALGAIQALMLTAAGYDQDELPEFIKTRNLIIPTAWRSDHKTYIAIPIGLGLHVLPNTGRIFTELALAGGKDLAKKMGSALGEVLGAFNPMGSANPFTLDGALKTVAPTVVDPAIELGFNRNFAGAPIERKPFNEEGDNRPGFSRARESTQRSATGQVYLGISKAVNTLTGGTAYEAGAASPTPEAVRYLAQTAGGGVLRETEKAINAAMDAAAGRPVKANALPLTGRFFGEVDSGQVEQSRYFDAKAKIQKLQSSAKSAEKAGDREAYRKLMTEHPELGYYDALVATQRSIGALNKLAAQTIEDPVQMKKIDEQRVAEMRSLNDALRKLESKAPTLADRLRAMTQ